MYQPASKKVLGRSSTCIAMHYCTATISRRVNTEIVVVLTMLVCEIYCNVVVVPAALSVSIAWRAMGIPIPFSVASMRAMP